MTCPSPIMFKLPEPYSRLLSVWSRHRCSEQTSPETMIEHICVVAYSEMPHTSLTGTLSERGSP